MADSSPLAWKIFPNGIHALGTFGRLHRVPQATGWVAFIDGIELGKFESFDDAKTAVEDHATAAGYSIDHN